MVVVLGEIHLKLGRAAAIGREVVGAFELRGIEAFQRKQVWGGRLLGLLLISPRSVIRWLSLGLVKGSTITEARRLSSGTTVELERAPAMPFGLHVASVYMAAFFLTAIAGAVLPLPRMLGPQIAGAIGGLQEAFLLHLPLLIPAILLRRFRWSWVVHPFLGILTLRDELMVAGTVRMLAEHPDCRAAVVVMGRAHVAGYERLLVERHGFRRLTADPLPRN